MTACLVSIDPAGERDGLFNARGGSCRDGDTSEWAVVPSRRPAMAMGYGIGRNQIISRDAEKEHEA
jgi:hypothetical protein